MQQQINRITDILRRDDWISWAMHYTEQISWILFLKFIDDYEKENQQWAILNGEDYQFIIDRQYQRDSRACPKTPDGKLDINNALTWDDLKNFVDEKLFPYLKSFKDISKEYSTMKYKIWEIFYFIDNRIESWHTLREILDIVDQLSFQNEDDLFQLSKIYEELLQWMWSDGGNAGEFYTPRPVIKTMVETIQPRIHQTVYDGATWSCWFLIEAFEKLKQQEKTTYDHDFLRYHTFYWNEKTPIAYIMGMMNMILHGIENPNISKQNSLTQDVRSIEEKDKYDIILANPPFGGKEKEQIQANFPIKTNATEMLFLQHFMKKLKIWWKAAIIVPEWVLFNTSHPFQKIKKELIENYNLHTICSLPAGVFLPYSGVKTNIIYFNKEWSTKNIWYYEVDPGRNLTKNSPLKYEELQDFVNLFGTWKETQNSRIVSVEDIKDYDLSAKNPNKTNQEQYRPPEEILEDIFAKDQKINSSLQKIRENLKS